MTAQLRTLLAVVPGVALVSLAGSLLDLPRADVIDALDSDRYRILWISGAYLAGSATGMVLTPLWVGLFGLRRGYLVGLGLFSLAAGLCGCVSAVIWMTPLRFLQGLGAGQVLSLGMLLVWRAFPERRDVAMSVYGLGVYLAVIAGGVLGGLIDTALTWRWLFWIDLPLGGMLLTVAWLLLPAKPQEAVPVRLDLVGVGAFLLTVVSLTVALDMGQYWGWTTSPYFVPWMLLAAASLAVFTAWGLLRERAAISLRPFSHRNFGVGILIKIVLTVNVTVLLHLLSGYMIGLRGYQWWQGSLVLLPGLLMFATVILASGLTAKPASRRLRIAVGFGVMATATWALSAADLYTSKYQTAALMAAWGAGVGLAVAPLLAVIFDGLTPDQTLQGAGLFNCTRAIPAFVAASLLATFLTQQTDYHFDRLRQRVTHNRPLAELTADDAGRRFRDLGSAVAGEQSHALIGKWVHANARAEALGDVLVVLTAVTAVGVPLTLLIRPTAMVSDN